MRCVRLFRPHPALRATFPLEGEGYYGGMVALSGSTRRFRPHPALARHLPHPGEGFFRLCKSFLFYLFNLTDESALSLCLTESPQ